MERISHSAGHGGMNLQKDVETVQTLLNRHRTPAQPLLTVDRVAGGLTIAAIREFQTRVVKMPKPDGRIDPKASPPNTSTLPPSGSLSRTPPNT